MRLFHVLSTVLIMMSCAIAGTGWAQSSTPTVGEQTVVIISSDPPEASVRLDSMYAGKTPLTLRLSQGKAHSLLLHKQGYHPSHCTVGPLHDDTLALAMTLDRLFGTVSIISGGPDHWISVDGKEIGKDRIDSLVLPLGTHHFAVSDPRFDRQVSQAIDVDQQRHMLIKASFRSMSLSRLFTGLFLPGYAQLDDHAYLKGSLLSIAGAGTIVYLISSVLRYNPADAGYRDALFRYDNASGEYAVIQARMMVDRKSEEFNTARTHLRAALAGVALVWVVNALDVAFNHALTDRIDVYSAPAQNPGISGVPEYRVSFALRIP